MRRTSDKISWQNWRNKLCPIESANEVGLEPGCVPRPALPVPATSPLLRPSEQLGPPRGHPFPPALHVQTRGGNMLTPVKTAHVCPLYHQATPPFQHTHYPHTRSNRHKATVTALPGAEATKTWQQHDLREDCLQPWARVCADPKTPERSIRGAAGLRELGENTALETVHRHPGFCPGVLVTLEGALGTSKPQAKCPSMP